jgi:hypothetical protein
MYIYTWREPRLNAIKIGHGGDPMERMRDYAKTYRLQYDRASLLKTAVPRDRGKEIETLCHDHATSIGLTRITRTGPLQEVFLLNGTDYTVAAAAIKREIARHAASAVPTNTTPTTIDGVPVPRSPFVAPNYREPEPDYGEVARQHAATPVEVTRYLDTIGYKPTLPMRPDEARKYGPTLFERVREWLR